jgi:hypothetical protein
MKTGAAPSAGIEERPTKIGGRHLERLAVVYIRQSSLHQVQHNQESTRLQYSLEAIAHELGWEMGRILVLDEDLGTSGASSVGRQDFQRLLAEVALDHVGIILGVEMSRLARSNKDWHQLLELCARFGTLIADLDGLYDPSLYNDRLLLGLKGDDVRSRATHPAAATAPGQVPEGAPRGAVQAGAVGLPAARLRRGRPRS